jgi:glycosyltransferase involved in cell wall biosynthesis
MICPEIGDSCGNAFIGGHVNNVIQLSKSLFDSGHAITIVTTPHRYPGDRKEEISDNIEYAQIVTLPVSGSFSSISYGSAYSIKTIKKIYELNKLNKFDIIHGHSGYSVLAMITGTSSKISNVPSIHSLYCPINPSRDYIVSLFSNGSLSRVHFSNIDKIVTVTDNIRRSLLSTGINGGDIVDIPIGINLEKYNTNISGKNIREIYNIDQKQPVLIYVGSLTTRKGLSVLVKSFKDILETMPNTVLFMLLNMPTDKYYYPSKLDADMKHVFEIKKLITHFSLEHCIIPVGIVDNLSDYMAASDVYVAPFLDTVGIADHPTSMLEAMAVGVPVVATDVGGISEIVKSGKTGILVEPGNVGELREGIIKLISDMKFCESLGANCSAMIRERFDINVVATKYESLYKEVVRNHRGN